MLSRFHSACLAVHDFDLAVEHYTTLIGARPAAMGPDRSLGPRVARFDLANTSLEIVALEALRAQRSSLPLAEEWIDRGEEGLMGIRLAVPEEGERPEAISGDESRGLFVELVESEPAREDSAALQIADPGAAIVGLDHVVVMSPAPDATRAFYGDRLGIRLALDKTFPDRGVRLIFFRLSGVTIEIGSRVGSPPDPARSDRFGGLAWKVADIVRLRDRLVSADFDVSEVRDGHKPGTRVCTVRDPVHGVPTLLIEPVSGPPRTEGSARGHT